MQSALPSRDFPEQAAAAELGTCRTVLTLRRCSTAYPLSTLTSLQANVACTSARAKGGGGGGGGGDSRGSHVT